jgi:repressor LexA
MTATRRCPECGQVLATSPRPLTRKQRALLDYCVSYRARHGYMPTLEEIAAFFGLSSLATVHEHLSNLERKGHIRRYPNLCRGIEFR